MFLKVAIDRDVAPVANFLREIGGVEDELGLEVGVGLVGCQETEIELQTEIGHRLVQEAGVSGFVAGHVGEALSQ